MAKPKKTRSRKNLGLSSIESRGKALGRKLKSRGAYGQGPKAPSMKTKKGAYAKPKRKR